MKLRLFEDLVKRIKYEGKTFVPIKELSIISFLLEGSDKKHKQTVKDFDNNNGYSCTYFFADEVFSFKITKQFDILVWNESTKENEFIYNQVQIIKNLIKWKFIES